MLMLGSCASFESKKAQVLALDEIRRVEIEHQVHQNNSQFFELEFLTGFISF